MPYDAPDMGEGSQEEENWNPAPQAEHGRVSFPNRAPGRVSAHFSAITTS
jgi:hypothetical protein